MTAHRIKYQTRHGASCIIRIIGAPDADSAVIFLHEQRGCEDAIIFSIDAISTVAEYTFGEISLKFERNDLRPTYRTTTVEDLYPDLGEYKVIKIYVYSVTNNPDGAGKGTDAQLLGWAEGYTTAADLWDAAIATARAIYGPSGSAEIGLCVEQGN
jgi:hypothetical protein